LVDNFHPSTSGDKFEKTSEFGRHFLIPKNPDQSYLEIVKKLSILLNSDFEKLG